MIKMDCLSDNHSRNAKRRKLRLMCIDLTGDIPSNNEENLPNRYQLTDVKDSCEINYNGELIEFNLKELKTIKILGQGNFALVNLVQLKEKPHVKFACKRLNLESDGNNNYSSQSDLKTLRMISTDHHPHIVEYYGCLIDLEDGQLILCMEVLPTSIDQFYPIIHSQISDISSSLFNQFIQRLAKHMILALDYLKSKNLIHRDLKPQNMLVTSQSIYKLCDFGICGILKDSLSSTHLGSMRYLPPERLGSVSSYGIRSDMWALGMSLYEVSEGSLPLSSESIMSFMSQMKNGWQPSFSSILQENTKEILSLLLRHDVNDRPRCYSDILSLSSMTNLEDNPSKDELNLVDRVIQILDTQISQ